MEGLFLEWVREQEVPVIIVLGLFVIGLIRERILDRKEKKEKAKEYRDIIKEKEALIAAKDKQTDALAEKIIKVASAWDIRSELNSKEHEVIKTLLTEMRDDIKDLKR